MSKTTFDLSTLDLAVGSHTVKVKAKADGYIDSDFSNELTVNVYSITSTLTNCTTDNTTSKFMSGVAYSATVTAADGYTFDGGTYALSIAGTDKTSDFIALSSDKKTLTISVPSTSALGNIELTCRAVAEASGFNLDTSNVSIPYENYAYFDITLGDGTVISSQLGDSTSIGSQYSTNYPKVSNPIPNVVKIKLYTYKNYPSVPYIRMKTSGTVLDKKQQGGSIELELTADTNVLILNGSA